jgi:hypothetical protein
VKTVSVTIPIESVRLAAEDVPGGRITPRIYSYTGVQTLPDSLEGVLFTSKDATSAEDVANESVTIPIYFIRSIAELDKSDVMVSFSIGHPQFDEEDQPDTIEGHNNFIFQVRLSKAVVATLRALFRLDDDAAIRVLSGSQGEVDEDSGFNIEVGKRTLFSLAFPPEPMENTWETVTEGMLGISFGPYAVVGNDNRTGAPSVFRTAQRLLYIAMLRLLDGEATEGVNRVDFIARSYERSTSMMTEVKGIQNDIDLAWRLLIRRIYASTSPSAGESEGGAFAEHASDSETDNEFNQLMSFNDMGAALVAVDTMSPYYRPLPQGMDVYSLVDPLINGVPTKMIRVADHLAKHEPNVLELCRWDFSREDVIERAENQYGSVSVAKAMLLVSAFRMARYIEQDGNTSALQRPLILARSISTIGDPYAWEIASFDEDLSIYNTAGFEELISCSFSGNESDSSNTVYLLTAMSQIIESLDKEGWTLDLIDARLRSSIHIPDLPKVRSLLACLLDSEGCDEDEDPVLYAIKSAYDTYDIEFLSHAVALTIPLLADYAAIEKGAAVGSPRWNEIRGRYIRRTMDRLSARLRRTHTPYHHDGDDDDDDDFSFGNEDD